MQRINQQYYLLGMSKHSKDYVSKCLNCQIYKIHNFKPTGLLQTPVYSQRFEVFGPLPETRDGYKWIFIFIVEDNFIRWIELLAIRVATAISCAKLLMDEVTKVISDNGPQFVYEVMQKVACCLNFDQSITPIHHLQSNPVEKKNCDLKTQLSVYVYSNTYIMERQIVSYKIYHEYCRMCQHRFYICLHNVWS